MHTYASKLLPAILLALAGCAGKTDSGCDRSDRSGTYLLTMDRIEGTCAEPDPSTVSFGLVDFNCEISDRSWSSDECSMTETIRCGGTDPGASETVFDTTQQDRVGDLITGTAETTVFGEDGAVTCEARYRVTYERQ